MRSMQELIEQAGLSKGEAKTYLALAGLGVSSVGAIVSKSGVSASKVYKILDKLIARGLVSSVVKEGVKEFKIEDPRALVEHVSSKEAELVEIKEELNKNLPYILEKVRLAENKSSCTVYEGMSGLRSVFDRSLEELEKGDTLYVSGISESTEEIREYFMHYYRKQARKGFKVKAIFDESAAYKAEERENKLAEFRYMPEGVITPASFIVYHDKTIIEVGQRHYVLTILINNKEIAYSFRKHFELLWKIAKRGKSKNFSR